MNTLLSILWSTAAVFIISENLLVLGSPPQVSTPNFRDGANTVNWGEPDSASSCGYEVKII